jgi:hypothetical protein
MMKGKRRASERDDIFTTTSNTNKAIKKPCREREISTRLEGKSQPHFPVRSKSKEELDFLYLRKVAEVKAKYEKLLKKNPKKLMGPEICMELKRCEECSDFINDSAMLLCDYCDDGYHMYCLNPPIYKKPVGDFACPACAKQLDLDGTVRTKLKGINMTITKKQKVNFIF